MLKYKIVVKSLNSEKKLNELTKKGVDIFNVERIDKSLIFFVKKDQLQEVLNFFQNEEILFYPFGAMQFFEFIKNRIGLICGCVCFLILLVISSNVVLNFKIEGLSSLQEKEIIDFLEQNGYNKFKLSSSINPAQIEDCLVGAFDEISFATAIVKGNTIFISIKEIEQKGNENFSPICADFSGVVSKINLKQGTLKVKVGDVVKKGQILVEPWEVNGSELISIAPKAEIFAKVFIKGQVKYDTKSKLKGRTGNYYEERSFSFLGINAKAKSNGDNQIKNGEFEIETEEQIISGLVPIKITRVKYFEIAEIKEADFERDKALLEKESRYLALEQIDSSFEIKSQRTEIINIDEVFYVTTYLEVDKNIVAKDVGEK